MKAIVCGYFCLDIAPNLDHLPEGQFRTLFQPGRLLQVGEAKFSGGGVVSNTGFVLHRLGIPTHFITKIGTDPLGRALSEIVSEQDQGLLKGIQIDEVGSTSYTLIFDPPGVDRTFINFPGTNDTFSIQDIDFEVIAKAHLFHFGYPPGMRQFYLNDGEELVALYKRVKTAGTTTSLDTSFPDPTREGGQVNWKLLLQRTLPYVDIFQPSVEELLVMLHPDTYEILANTSGDVIAAVTPKLLTVLSDELLDLGVKVVLIKLGHRGAYLRTAGKPALQRMGRSTPHNLSSWSNHELWTSCFQVDVAGTTGSGDATIAGFLSALLRNTSAPQALTMAVAVGACSVEGPDSLSNVLTWEETMDRINQGWQRHPLDLSSDGWRKDETHGLWVNPLRD
jgi:sugar/nucleoside kinase (ribokinase family)